jgi:hypothetical protein
MALGLVSFVYHLQTARWENDASHGMPVHDVRLPHDTRVEGGAPTWRRPGREPYVDTMTSNCSLPSAPSLHLQVNARKANKAPSSSEQSHGAPHPTKRRSPGALVSYLMACIPAPGLPVHQVQQPEVYVSNPALNPPFTAICAMIESRW